MFIQVERLWAALSAENGDMIWSVNVMLSLRGGPTVMNEKAVVVTDLDGNIFAYSLSNGSLYGSDPVYRLILLYMERPRRLTLKINWWCLGLGAI